MAIREGRCQNCGSIIRVQDQEPTVRCIFCWAETPTAKALELVNAPDDYEFPNKKIEQPDDEERSEVMLKQLGISGQATQQAMNRQKTHKVIKEKDQLSAVERVKAMTKENKIVKVPNVKPKQMITIAIVVVLVIGLFLLLTLPGYNRYKVRAEELNELLEQKTEIEISPETEIRYGNRNFTEAMILHTEGELSESEAEDMARLYARSRAELFDHPDDPYRDPLSLTILSDGSAFDVSLDAQGEATIEPRDLIEGAPVGVPSAEDEEAEDEESADEEAADDESTDEENADEDSSDEDNASEDEAGTAEDEATDNEANAEDADGEDTAEAVDDEAADEAADDTAEDDTAEDDAE